MPTCKCGDLDRFLDGDGDSGTEFYRHDLDALLTQPNAQFLRLKRAECSLSLSDHAAVETEEHNVAVAVDSLGNELISTIVLAALPCPPHCGEHKLSDYPKCTITTYYAAPPPVTDHDLKTP